MKAAIIREFGDPSVLTIAEVDTPRPRPGHVLVKILAAGVNRFDHYIREGSVVPDLQFPHILGTDAAGEIAEIGPGVDTLRVGDRVVPMTGYPDDPDDADIHPNSAAPRIFVAIEVWSRLWPSTVTGRRSYRNTLALVRDIANRMDFERLPLIVTDGFEFYEKVVRRVFGPAVLYGQVLKTRRHDRIVQVERRARMGAPWRFEEALTNSEDSSTLNTSFIERLNLTIRQGSAYLSRRTLSHARSADKLDGHLELLRCHYNFVRPHGALTFGREVRTPAMQAGLATRRLTFREVFVCPPPSLLVVVSIGTITCAVPSRLPTAPVRDELLAA